MDYLDMYTRRVLAKGENDKDRSEFEGKRNFKEMLKKRLSPTVYEVVVMLNDNNSTVMQEKTVLSEINNVTRNDQDKYDEKYIKFELDELITYGSYINWSNAQWLILFEENNTFDVYQTFTMRRCNNIFKFKYKGVSYEIPQIVKNLTLYSDGLSDESYISKPEAKRQITMVDNELTKNIKPGTRIMLSGTSVFEVTHVDDFSAIGNRIMICTQTTLHSLDDLENNIAYNEDSETPIIPPTSLEIMGNDDIYLGDFITYEVINGNGSYTWNINSDFVTITNQDIKSCDIECNDDVGNVGKTFELELYENDIKITSKIITVRGLC